MNSLSLVKLNKVRLSFCGENVTFADIGKCTLLSNGCFKCKNIGIVP